MKIHLCGMKNEGKPKFDLCPGRRERTKSVTRKRALTVAAKSLKTAGCPYFLPARGRFGNESMSVASFSLRAAARSVSSMIMSTCRVCMSR